MHKDCKAGNHKWHFNGLAWTCRRGCGAAKDRDGKMVREPSEAYYARNR